MASEEDPTVYGEDDLDEDDDDDISDEEEDDLTTLPASNPPQPQTDHLDDDLDDEDDLLLDDDDDTSSSAGKVTVAVPNFMPLPASALVTVAASSSDSLLPDPKQRHRIDEVTIAATAAEKKPPAAMDDSRRLFQRLWTDEDEIELLQGFLDYTAQRGGGGGNHHHHDTAAFYDQIKSKLQLDFNKNQLVEKLRRLKKKYRNVLNKIGSGKEYVFKSPHDQATFDISRKIWSSGGGLDDDEGNHPNTNPNLNFFDHNNNGIDANSSERKGGSKSRKRSRAKIEEKQQFNQQPPPQTVTPPPTVTSIPSLIEETVRSCLSPLFKELLHNTTTTSASGGVYGSRGYGGVAALNPIPLGFGSPAGLNFSGRGDVMDDKWRKQQILELEVYSKRLELVQDQIKSALDELRSMGS